MATLIEMCQKVRLGLGNPLPESPGLMQTYAVVLRQSQSFYNQLNNVSVAWATNETQIYAAQDQADYPITAQGWGKCLLVSTVDTANTNHWERWVPFYEPQNLLLAYDGPRDGANWFGGFLDGSQHTALGIAFMRDHIGNINARIRPVPQASATYNVLYAVGDWAGTAGITSLPVLPEHHHLIECLSALALLPDARWHVLPTGGTLEQQAIVEKMNRDQRADRERALLREVGQYQRDFEHAKRSQVGAKLTFKRKSSY